jgi:hypothetical protein
MSPVAVFERFDNLRIAEGDAMTEHESREVKILTMNIQAAFTAEMILALCAALLEIELSRLKAWLARLGDHGA